MKMYSFKCSVAMGNMFIQETKDQKKAMVAFLKAFRVKPSISEIETAAPEPPKFEL